MELLTRCEDFLRREPMQQYVLRHSAEWGKLKEAGVRVPDALACWLLVSRTATPPWTELQAKTMCFGDVQVDKVCKALLKIFGLDSAPYHKEFVPSKVSFIHRDREWRGVGQNIKGHFVFDLLDGVEKFYGEALYFGTVCAEPEKSETISIPEEIDRQCHHAPGAREDLASVSGRVELLQAVCCAGPRGRSADPFIDQRLVF